jgi:hypothetical protein
VTMVAMEMVVNAMVLVPVTLRLTLPTTLEIRNSLADLGWCPGSNRHYRSGLP